MRRIAIFATTALAASLLSGCVHSPKPTVAAQKTAPAVTEDLNIPLGPIVPCGFKWVSEKNNPAGKLVRDDNPGPCT